MPAFQMSQIGLTKVFSLDIKTRDQQKTEYSYHNFFQGFTRRHNVPITRHVSCYRDAEKQITTKIAATVSPFLHLFTLNPAVLNRD